MSSCGNRPPQRCHWAVAGRPQDSHAVNTSRDMTLLSVRARACAAVLAHASLLVRVPPRMTFSNAGPSSSRLSMVMPECAAPAITGTSA